MRRIQDALTLVLFGVRTIGREFTLRYQEKQNKLSISELAEQFGESIDNVSMEALMEAIYNERHAPNASLLQQSEQQTKEKEKD